MKKIAILIDFSEGSVSALQQAIGYALKTGASLYCVHVVSNQEKVKKAEQDLVDFNTRNGNATIKIENVVTVGDLASATQLALKRIHPDLVFVCTHGIKGMFQYFFGAHILKLVQSIGYPCIVIHETAKTMLIESKSILFPIGPHPEFMLKTKQTTAYAKALDIPIVVYEIDRPGNEYNDFLIKNAEEAMNYFELQKVPFTHVVEELEVMSVGFSRQTINYALKNNIYLISLMANVSKNDSLFGFGDKESFLVNEQGVSILSCN